MTEKFKPKIEPDVPIPEARGQSKAHEYRKALKRLSIGDSFWYPAGHEEKPIKGAHRMAKEIGIEIVLRKVKENDSWGTRTWRTK